MKTTLFSIITLAIAPFLFGQNVNIPDANFKAYLVGEPSINTNSDTEIQVSEANGFSGKIDVSSQSISDMTGLEAFTSLDTLICSYNNLTSLDVSQNTSLVQLISEGNTIGTLDLSNNPLLESLNCTGSGLSALDLSQNPALVSLNCRYNSGINSLDLSNNSNLGYLNTDGCSLSSIDLSLNTDLYYLSARNTQITDLDLSLNTSLTYLNCSDNQLLESLDVKNGNNTNVTVFYTTNCPNLTCIQVDDATYSTNNWTNVDPASSFSENCSLSIEDETTIEFSVYPNPAIDVINISSNQEIESVFLFDINGQLIKKTTAKNIAVGELNAGVYLVQVTTSNGVLTKRIVKQ